MAYDWSQDASVQEMQKSNPNAFKTTQDAVNWGKRYYGWTDNGPAAQAAAQPAAAPAPAATPAAAPNSQPTPYSTDPNVQKTVTNSYMEQAQQGTKVDPNDPNIKQQTDPYNAQVERAKRDYLTSNAEKMSTRGMGNSGAAQNEERLASERAGQAKGSFEAQLVGRELQNRRAEIQNALSQLGGMVNSDQGRALQLQLAQMDAELKKLGIMTGAETSKYGVDSAAQTAAAERALKDKLGMAGLNLDQMRMLLQNQQFGQNIGLQTALGEGSLNNQALQLLMQ